MISVDDFNNLMHHAAGGKWEPTAANFPACKMLFHPDDIPVDLLSWPSRIGDLIIHSSSDLITFGYVSGGVNGASPTLTGTLPVVGDLHPVLINAGYFVTGNNHLDIGDYTKTGMQTKAGANPSISKSAGNTNIGSAVSPAPAYPYSGAQAVFADKANEKAFMYTASDDGAVHSVNDGGVTTGSIAGTWPAFTTDTISLIGSGGSSSMIALFCFATPPVDVDTAVLWMAANPGKLYPGWAGKA